MMLRAFGVLCSIVVVLGLSGCSTEPPSARIFNERSTKANIQLKPQAGNTININDVAGGAATVYQDIGTGMHLATATIQNESVSPTVAFDASDGNNYTVVVVNSTPPTLRVDASGK
jgi:hypothetical protein